MCEQQEQSSLNVAKVETMDTPNTKSNAGTERCDVEITVTDADTVTSVSENERVIIEEKVEEIVDMITENELLEVLSAMPDPPDEYTRNKDELNGESTGDVRSEEDELNEILNAMPDPPGDLKSGEDVATSGEVVSSSAVVDNPTADTSCEEGVTTRTDTPVIPVSAEGINVSSSDVETSSPSVPGSENIDQCLSDDSSSSTAIITPTVVSTSSLTEVTSSTTASEEVTSTSDAVESTAVASSVVSLCVASENATENAVSSSGVIGADETPSNEPSSTDGSDESITTEISSTDSQNDAPSLDSSSAPVACDEISSTTTITTTTPIIDDSNEQVTSATSTTDGETVQDISPVETSSEVSSSTDLSEHNDSVSVSASDNTSDVSSTAVVAPDSCVSSSNIPPTVMPDSNDVITTTSEISTDNISNSVDDSENISSPCVVSTTTTEEVGNDNNIASNGTCDSCSTDDVSESLKDLDGSKVSGCDDSGIESNPDISSTEQLCEQKNSSDSNSAIEGE